MSGKWLTIQEFSNINNISISTIRRKIKSGKFKSKLVDGKYQIFNNDFSIEETSRPAFSCPALSTITQKDHELSALNEQNQSLRQEIEELKMLLKVLEQKTGIKVTI